MENHIHIHKDFGWFIGTFDNNQEHKHYAIQLSIPIDGEIVIKTSETTIKTDKPVLIKSNVIHKIASNSHHFLLLINPASTIGHFWNHLSDKAIHTANFTPAVEIMNVLDEEKEHQISTPKLNSIIKVHDCFCSSAIHQGDDRINEALIYLSTYFDRIVPIEEIAKQCHLSESRFLHLFKQETGITYRRAQLWYKLINALPLFGRKSFTEIAYQNGFSDSAHLSRTFKENFGFAPRDFLKISQFIQV